MFANLFICGLCAHLFADWFLQNEWQAHHKVSLKHPAAYVHSGLHVLCLLPLFPWFVALVVGVTHLLIDTRKPLQWWRKLIGQTVYKPIPEYGGVYPVHEAEFCHNSAAFAVAFWQDQVAHILVIFGAAAWVAGGVR